MQALLAERFKLQVHTETRVVPVYELVAARGGVHLPAAKTPCYARDLDRPTPPPASAPPWGLGRSTRDGIEVLGSTMPDFCVALSRMPLRLDRRKFVDKTGVAGHFDFNLRFPADLSGGPAASGPDADEERLQLALRSAGLQLRPAKGTDEVIVIDRAGRATQN